MKYDEYITQEEIMLMQTLKGKSRMEQDQIIYEYERGKKIDIVRNDSASTGTIRTITK